MDEYLSKLTDGFTQIIYKRDGRLLKFAMPYPTLAYTFGFAMYQKVHQFFIEAAMPRPIEYIVDVGACIGVFSVPYTFMWPNAEILSIEPSKYNFPYLKYNIKEFPQINAIKILASDEANSGKRLSKPSQIQKHSSEESFNGILSIYGQDYENSEFVPADKLDNLVDRQVDWLKIDVEGHERKVLEGAERILKEDKPMLQIEISQLNQDMAGYSASGLWNDIFKYNYRPVGGIRNDVIFRSTDSL